MGYFFSKNQKPKIEFQIFSKDEIDIIKNLGYFPHPDLSVSDIVFLSENTIKIFGLNEADYYTKYGKNWKKIQASSLSSNSKCIENYLIKYCIQKSILLNNIERKIWIYKY